MEEKKENILSLLGINFEDEKIEIDLKQAKNFFENLQKTLEQKSKEINESIKEGKVDLSDTVGIKIEEERISLDLKKTKSFFESFLEKVEQIAKDIEKSINSLEDKSNNKPK